MQEKKHAQKVGTCKGEKLLGMEIRKAIVEKDLDQNVPAVEKAFLVHRRLRGASASPDLSESLPRLG
jgi:hypothetical protein